MKWTALFVLLAVSVVVLLRWRVGDFRTEAQRKQVTCASLNKELDVVDGTLAFARGQLPQPQTGPGRGVRSTADADAEKKQIPYLQDNITRLTRRREEVNQQIGLHHCDNK